MECVYSHGTSEHGVSKPFCQKNFQSSPPKPFMGRLKLFKNAFKPTIAEDHVTSFKNYPGWILWYIHLLSPQAGTDNSLSQFVFTNMIE